MKELVVLKFWGYLFVQQASEQYTPCAQMEISMIFVYYKDHVKIEWPMSNVSHVSKVHHRKCITQNHAITTIYNVMTC